MKRFFNNLHIDLIAAALIVGMIATGYILRFPLPPGSNKSLVLWGLTRHEWGDIHFWISLGLLAIVLLHICLHWQWVHISIKRLFSRAKGGPTIASGLLTLAGFLAIFGVFAWAAHHGVEQITEPLPGVCSSPDTDLVESETTRRGETASDLALAHPNEPARWEKVSKILEESCLRCHGPKRQQADFRVDRKEDFGRGFAGAPLIIPGKSDESSLIGIVSGQTQLIGSQDVHRLPAEKVAVIKAWIDDGARWTDDAAH